MEKDLIALDLMVESKGKKRLYTWGYHATVQTKDGDRVGLCICGQATSFRQARKDAKFYALSHQFVNAEYYVNF